MFQWGNCFITLQVPRVQLKGSFSWVRYWNTETQWPPRTAGKRESDANVRAEVVRCSCSRCSANLVPCGTVFCQCSVPCAHFQRIYFLKTKRMRRVTHAVQQNRENVERGMAWNWWPWVRCSGTGQDCSRFQVPAVKGLRTMKNTNYWKFVCTRLSLYI